VAIRGLHLLAQGVYEENGIRVVGQVVSRPDAGAYVYCLTVLVCVVSEGLSDPVHARTSRLPADTFSAQGDVFGPGVGRGARVERLMGRLSWAVNL